jgi:hypothetical protein
LRRATRLGIDVDHVDRRALLLQPFGEIAGGGAKLEYARSGTDPA